MPASAVCPACSAVLSGVPDSLIGKTIRCTSCREPVKVVASASPSVPKAAALAPPPSAPRVARAVPVPAPNDAIDVEVMDDAPIDVEVMDDDAPPAKRKPTPVSPPAARRPRADDTDESEPVPMARRPKGSEEDRPTRKSVVRPAAADAPPAKGKTRRGEDDDQPKKKKSALPLILGLVVGLIVLGGAGAAVAFFMNQKTDTAKGTEGVVNPPTTPRADPPRPPEIQPSTPVKLPEDPPRPVDPPIRPSDPPVKPSDPPKPMDTAVKPGDTPVKQTDPPVKPPVNKDRISPEALARLKKSTVYIEVEDGNGGGGSGSGWFGGEPGLVITNAHVIGMITPGTKEPAKVTIYTDSGERGKQKQYEGQKVKVLAVDRDMDLAVLQIINEKDLPPPLPIRPAVQTQQLDKLLCLGFPGGRRLADRNRSTDPPTITVTETTLSAYRNDDGGNLYSVQIQGGVVHGNSGGPVADLDGNVIGVAVRVDLDSDGRFTNIAYAVPGEYVTGLLDGRAAEGIIGQGFVQGDRVVYPVKVRCADAMNRLKSVGVAVWVAEKGPRRPAGDKHQEEKGDVGYREIPLVYDKVKKVAVGLIDFPRNADGRAYWAQAYYSNTASAKRYLAGTTVPDADPPVEQATIDLSPRFPVGTEFKLSVVHALKVSERLEKDGVEAAERRVVAQEFNAKEMVEKPKTASGHAQLDLITVGDAVKMQVTLPGDKPSLPKELIEAKEALTRWNGLVSVGRDGKVSGTTLGPLGLSVTDKAKKDVATRLAQQWAETAAESHIKLPAKSVKAGDTWTDSYPHKFKLRQELLTSEPAGRTAVIGTVKEDVTYTYLGRRDRAGRGEAVILVEGLLHPVGVEAVTCGKVEGRVIVDERTGMVIDLLLKRDFDLDARLGDAVIEAAGTEVVKVTREK